ncbi:MAG: hypothetical protein K2K74_11905, partial [Lachnospiraceae bacterium]|nr:hypothetical protein [Lachnospiraceae bacterium]
KELSIPAKNVAARNKPENLDLTLLEVENQEDYKIRISGTKAAVDAVNAENVIGVVDMNGLLENLGLSEWSVGSYQGDITFNLPENVKLDHTYQMTIILEEIADEVNDDMNNIE